MPEMDPERRRILLASATLAAMGGSGMAPLPAQEDDQAEEEVVPDSIMAHRVPVVATAPRQDRTYRVALLSDPVRFREA